MFNISIKMIILKLAYLGFLYFNLTAQILSYNDIQVLVKIFIGYFQIFCGGL